jgi:CHASE3 domain sensor protein
VPFTLITLHVRRYAAVLYILTILVVVTSISILSARSFLAGKAWVDHTAEVISSIQTVQTTLLNAETGQRGYLLTKNTTYLEPYQDALLTIDRQLDNLEDLVADNDTQVQRVRQLRVLVGEFFDRLKKEKVDELDQTKYLMDSIRVLIIKMISAERILMSKRLLTVDDAVVVLLVCLSIVVVRDLIVMVWAFHDITQSNRPVDELRSPH